MTKFKIFISYAHSDQKWVDRLRTHINISGYRESIHVWDDRQIAPGEMWQGQLLKAINEAMIAILLISPDYLSSNFIVGEELPALLRRRETEGLIILPILVRACLWHEVEWLRSIQFWPIDAEPLASLQDHKIDESLAEFSKFVVASFERDTHKQSTEEISVPQNNVWVVSGTGRLLNA